MRLLTLLSFVPGLLHLGSAAPNPTGSLSFASNKELYTFEYSTPNANAKNWIGIYHATGGGPDDEMQVTPSLRWSYAPNAKGSLTIKPPVGGGKFKAYFLADDGYKWIAKPIEVTAKETNTDELKVMTWNLWHGGTKVNGYHDKQVKFLTGAGVDVVGLQEATGDHAKRLGEALGWNYHQDGGDNSVGIISRLPIIKRHGKIGRGSGVQLALKGDTSKPFNFWSAHLAAYPYGPYSFCFEKKSASDVTADENEAGRPSQIKELIDGTKSQRESNIPFSIVGDFNAPSHLDWTSANNANHCGKSFDWPTSKIPTDAGLIDSFRKVHPDPKAVSGDSWSPIYPKNADDWASQPEPQDRIDFIYGTSKLEVKGSEVRVVGTPSAYPNYENNEWTSDHRCVITTYKMP
ncbi:DNase I-like protein [Paraphaeosphaeria sporulosa]|uniref:DNase I-like protein n=1 Tax=Paraphaeosphaeria sporulosa TaxID=1460663 RepID=A0A177CAX3_9PLEO|nr:DNase I-like protein [Paraphaeosphaeria sporulosa]OAG04813.1 DNase I-like protein [Paraphaeosphaeria sporulosa]